MAEPVGLALGAVALVSLFSSCVELIEYFELGKSYEYDYDKACLKLALLRTRLQRWGLSSQLGVSDCDADKVYAYDWTPHGQMIRFSLRGIHDILGNAELLQDKYSLKPSKQRSAILSVLRKKAAHKERSKPASSPRSRQPGLTRRATTWAIRDKRKFESLIHDLDFFVCNLEKSTSFDSWDLKRAMEPAEASLEKETSKSRAGSVIEVVGKQQGQLVVMERMSAPERARGGTAEQAKIAHGSGSESTSGTSGSRGSSYAHALSFDGVEYTVGKVEEKATAHQGAIGRTKLPEAPPGQTASFRVGTVTGQAVYTAGAMSDELYEKMLKARD